MGQQGDEVREKNGPPCQKSLRLGWVIGSSKHWKKKDHAEMSSFAHCACWQKKVNVSKKG